MKQSIRSQLFWFISVPFAVLVSAGIVIFYRTGWSLSVELILAAAFLFLIAGIFLLRSATREESMLLSKWKESEEKISELLQVIREFDTRMGMPSSQMEASSRHLSETIEKQLSITKEVSGTAKRISSNTEELIQRMQEVSPILRSTEDLIVEGQERLVRMSSMIEGIENAAEFVGTSLGGINEKAERIGGVLTSISKVSAKTNLLSFNAAIEAEKAGELGHGFAVVGREVRQLSDQAELAALDLEKTVKSITTAISAGKMETDKFREQVSKSIEEIRELSSKLAEIVDFVQKLTPLLDRAVQNMREQSLGAGQIQDNVTDLSSGARETMESLKSTTEAADQLQTVLQDVLGQLARFQLDES